jgi:6-phosphogluconate dehydrogenase
MVHNGIEYGYMELIAEAYDFLRRGLGLGLRQVEQVFKAWNRSELESYLMDITARILTRTDGKAGEPLIDQILDAARQKGTGKWTSQDAMELQVPTPTIDAAVMMRNLSAYKEARREAAGQLDGPRAELSGSSHGRQIRQLKDALYSGLILTFAQGMDLLRKASQRYGYGLDLAEVARIWRGGCIIRASLLEDIHAAYHGTPGLENLMLHPKLAQELENRQQALRSAAAAALQNGIPFAAFAASVAYFDGYRSTWLPADLIQAQRDYFGSHRYERVDAEGTFHTQWIEH